MLCVHISFTIVFQHNSKLDLLRAQIFQEDYFDFQKENSVWFPLTIQYQEHYFNALQAVPCLR